MSLAIGVVKSWCALLMRVMFTLLSEGLAEPCDAASRTVQPTQQSLYSVHVGVKVHNYSGGNGLLVNL